MTVLLKPTAGTPPGVMSAAAIAEASMSEQTHDQKWESLASEYLRRLAAEDMRQWERHYRFEDRSTAPAEQRAVDGVLSTKERDRRKLMRVTSRATYGLARLA
jgi:hypothetical protein